MIFMGEEARLRNEILLKTLKPQAGTWLDFIDDPTNEIIAGFPTSDVPWVESSIIPDPNVLPEAGGIGFSASK